MALAMQNVIRGVCRGLSSIFPQPRCCHAARPLFVSSECCFDRYIDPLEALFRGVGQFGVKIYVSPVVSG